MRIEVVENQNQGFDLAKSIIYQNCDPRTVLFLSGGNTPRSLYKKLSIEKKLNVGAVGMVDERFVDNNSPNSNKKIIKDSKLVRYLTSRKIPFHSIVNTKIKNFDLESLGKSVMDYDNKVTKLFKRYPKKVAILGIGEDGHTAGIPVGTDKLELGSKKYAIGFSDFPGEFKKRISLTFKALSEMDLLLIMMFGEKKIKSLKLIFTQGSIYDIPARFFNLSEISNKTIVVTDQRV